MVNRISTLMRSMKNIFGRSFGSRSSMTGWGSGVMVGTRDEPFILMVNPLFRTWSSDLPRVDDAIDLGGRLVVALRAAHDLERVEPRLRGIEERRQVDPHQPVGRLVVSDAVNHPR